MLRLFFIENAYLWGKLYVRNQFRYRLKKPSPLLENKSFWRGTINFCRWKFQWRLKIGRYFPEGVVFLKLLFSYALSIFNSFHLWLFLPWLSCFQYHMVKSFGIFSGQLILSSSGPYPYHLTTYFACGLVPTCRTTLSTVSSCSWKVSFELYLFWNIILMWCRSSIKPKLFVLSEEC